MIPARGIEFAGRLGVHVSEIDLVVLYDNLTLAYRTRYGQKWIEMAVSGGEGRHMVWCISPKLVIRRARRDLRLESTGPVCDMALVIGAQG